MALLPVSRHRRAAPLLVLLVLLGLAVAPTPASGQTTPARAVPTSRDLYRWPFAPTSIWNMPIGSGAAYVPAGLQGADAWHGQVTRDNENIALDPSAPLRRVNGTGEQVHVPSTLTADGRWNNCSTLLRPDGHTIVQGQPMRLAAGGDPHWTWTTPSAPVDLRGDGRLGCHGGSGLSGLGGSLRPGELNGPDPIRHVLKVNLYANRFLSPAAGGYRWPAVRADSYAAARYRGPVPALRMGSLLALPPGTDLSWIRSAHARKLAEALVDYGAYVVDDTAWDVHAVALDRNAEFGDGGTFHRDLQRVFTLLHVVDNNGPTTVGGGGTPRQPLAPPFGADQPAFPADTSTGAAAVGVAATPSGDGYWIARADGSVSAHGAADHRGDARNLRLNGPIRGVVATASGDGYWLVASDGGTFAYGDARFHGSMGGRRLNQPVVSMAPTPSGNGYWLVASDGGIFAFGDATFVGSMGGRRLNQPVLGLTVSPSGAGYRMVASDGGVFAFGDAPFLGSTGAQPPASPVVAMTTVATAPGYWTVTADGAVYAFGAAGYFGNLTGSGAVVGMAGDRAGRGYVLVDAQGRVQSFGPQPPGGR